MDKSSIPSHLILLAQSQISMKLLFAIIATALSTKDRGIDQLIELNKIEMI